VQPLSLSEGRIISDDAARAFTEDIGDTKFFVFVIQIALRRKGPKTHRALALVKHSKNADGHKLRFTKSSWTILVNPVCLRFDTVGAMVYP